MPAIALSGDGVITSPWSPSPAIISKTGNVRINGRTVVVHGDVIPTHTRFLFPTHTSPTMIASQGTIRVNGQGVIVNGDRASCDATHTVVANSGNVNIV
jgi:uncharacterized Zn-binding protein involved in type VI secretion